MKTLTWERSLKMATTIASSLPKVNDSSDPKSVISLFKAAQRKATKTLKSKEFNDVFQTHFEGKWAIQAESVNSFPIVATAFDVAEAQQALYMDDMDVTTPAGQHPVAPGNYHAEPTIVNGVTVVNSYYQLFAAYMQRDFAGNWIVVHAEAWGSKDRIMKENMTVVAHVDKHFRAQANVMRTTNLPTVPD